MMNGRDECNEKKTRIWGWWKHYSKWTDEKRWRRRKAALWRQSFMRWCGKMDMGARGIKKSGGWGKRGGWSDEGSLAYAQQYTEPTLLSCFYLTLFSPAFCSPEISEWVGETECARKLQSVMTEWGGESDRGRSRLGTVGRNFKIFIW